jgi:hypothetical protein
VLSAVASGAGTTAEVSSACDLDTKLASGMLGYIERKGWSARTGERRRFTPSGLGRWSAVYQLTDAGCAVHRTMQQEVGLSWATFDKRDVQTGDRK